MQREYVLHSNFLLENLNISSNINSILVLPAFNKLPTLTCVMKYTLLTSKIHSVGSVHNPFSTSNAMHNNFPLNRPPTMCLQCSYNVPLAHWDCGLNILLLTESDLTLLHTGPCSLLRSGFSASTSKQYTCSTLRPSCTKCYSLNQHGTVNTVCALWKLKVWGVQNQKCRLCQCVLLQPTTDPNRKGQWWDHFHQEHGMKLRLFY